MGLQGGAAGRGCRAGLQGAAAGWGRRVKTQCWAALWAAAVWGCSVGPQGGGVAVWCCRVGLHGGALESATSAAKGLAKKHK